MLQTAAEVDGAVCGLSCQTPGCPARSLGSSQTACCTRTDGLRVVRRPLPTAIPQGGASRMATLLLACATVPMRNGHHHAICGYVRTEMITSDGLCHGRGAASAHQLLEGLERNMIWCVVASVMGEQLIHGLIVKPMKHGILCALAQALSEACKLGSIERPVPANRRSNSSQRMRLALWMLATLRQAVCAITSVARCCQERTRLYQRSRTEH